MNVMIIVLTMLLALPAVAQAPDAEPAPEAAGRAQEESVPLEADDREATAEEVEAASVQTPEEAAAQAGAEAPIDTPIEAQAEAKAEVQAVAPAPAAPVRKGTEVVNLSDTIVGNQEQPTVLYIVPWKPAEDTTILYLPLSSKAMEHIFGHVERVEHQRQVQYIDQLEKE